MILLFFFYFSPSSMSPLFKSFYILYFCFAARYFVFSLFYIIEFICMSFFVSLSLYLISGCWFAHKYAYVYSQVLRAHFCSLFLFRSFVRFSSSPHLFRKLTTVNTSPEKPSLSIDIYCYDFDSILILRMCFDFDFDSTPKKCLK